MAVEGEVGYVNDPPERDIGPNTNRNVIMRDLRQMSNDYSSINLGVEVAKMKKLENIYSLTDNTLVKDSDQFKVQIKEKKMMLEELNITNAQLKLHQKRKGHLALTDGSGIDQLEEVNNRNIDKKLLEMEKRIVEAKRVIDSRDSDHGLRDALNNYHEVFKQSMESIENIARSRSVRNLPKMTNFRHFIDRTEKTLVSDGKGGDAEVTKALNELKRLNKHKTFEPNQLPYIPQLPYDYEEELSHLNIMTNDILEDLGVQDEVVEIPVTKFLEHVPKLKPAKSIMKRIVEAEKKSKDSKKKSQNKVRFQ